MKRAMKYLGKTPDEIVCKYMRGVRIKQGLIILVWFIYIVAAIQGIWWNGKGNFDVLLMLLIFFMLVMTISVLIEWDFIALNLILNENCDSVTYYQVMRLLGKKRHRRRMATTIQIHEASGLMWTGRFHEALALAQSLSNLNVNDQLSVLFIRFSCYMEMENGERALQVKRETEALVSTIQKPALQKRGKQLVNIMSSRLALQQGDYDTFRAVEKTRMDKIIAKNERVAIESNFAKADLAQGETQNARARLEYVVSSGGTLYVVEDARRLLAELDRKRG